MEEGVKKITERLDQRAIDIIPEEGQLLDFRDIEERIDNTRVLGVRKIEVIAVGRVEKFTQQYYTNTPRAHYHDWYRLIIGEDPSDAFVLAEGEKLEALKRTGYERIAVIGTVTNLNRVVPILYMTEFIK
jgi:hypothetical protein